MPGKDVLKGIDRRCVGRRRRDDGYVWWVSGPSPQGGRGFAHRGRLCTRITKGCRDTSRYLLGLFRVREQLHFDFVKAGRLRSVDVQALQGYPIVDHLDQDLALIITDEVGRSFGHHAGYRHQFLASNQGRSDRHEWGRDQRGGAVDVDLVHSACRCARIGITKRQFHVPAVVPSARAATKGHPPSNKRKRCGVVVRRVHRPVVQRLTSVMSRRQNVVDVDDQICRDPELELDLSVFGGASHALPRAVVRLVFSRMRYSWRSWSADPDSSVSRRFHKP